MYTIKGFLDKDHQAAVLASAKDLPEVAKKAADFRKQGLYQLKFGIKRALEYRALRLRPKAPVERRPIA